MASPDRACSVLVRMSHEHRDQLRRDAAALGITVQALAERRLLGIPDAQPLPPGRVPRRQQREELPMTG